MKKADLSLTALRIEGGLLPAEFIQRLLELNAGHQSASDYAVPPGLNLKDEIGRYWRIASALWADFKVHRDKPGTKPEQVALSHWLVPLFTRVLGFDQWRATSGEMLRERRFPLTHKLGVTPLLLLPHTVDLDRSDARFAPEGRRRSPYATVQEYLNANDQANWGVVANGHTLRILRDNPSLTRPAYIEADLARILDEERYADFVALWLLAHGTRFGDGARDHHDHVPILEHWHRQAQATGERALEKLRNGVTEALRQLGNGFITHPGNTALREALQREQLTTEDYFKQLLRLVYRLILLHTAEDRGLLHAPAATPAQRDLYAMGYSAARLREHALKNRADRHADLWQGLVITLRGLATGAEALGLPALGGLFAADRCSDLDAADLPNKALLAAVRALCFFRAGAVLARINYRDMDTEELGSVYESLLEQQPAINVDTNPWRFGFVADEAEGEAQGSARRLTGSYYTPGELVQELVTSALVPKIAEASKEVDPRAALLALKVIDPASGSGHFLLASARRIAAEVARLDADSDIPEAAAFRHALREVVAHCIYGVDLNPLAVELCQTALWLETLEPGKPLGFLDHRIRHGNSLVGILDPAVMQDGIPDAAYTALSGDNRLTCTALRRTNRTQAGGRQRDFFTTAAAKVLADANAALDAMPEDTVDAIAVKRTAFAAAEADEQRARERLRADLFCAAFFAPKTVADRARVPLSGDLALAGEGQPLHAGTAELTSELATEFDFFHWRLAFPEVFAAGGFDVVLTNPPWERIKLQEQEFFAARSSEIASAANAAARTRLIEALNAAEASPADARLYRDFIRAKRGAEATSLFAHESNRFPLTGVGDVNLYALFAESIAELIGARGRAGMILPTGIASDDSTSAFFDKVSQSEQLVSLLAFENEEFVFPAVHHSFKFCLVTLGHAERADFVFFARHSSQIRDPRRRFTLSREEFRLINPNSRTCPTFRSQVDAAITKRLYRSRPVLIDEGVAGSNPWKLRFTTMFHMSSDSSLFSASPMPGQLPLYEGKMIEQYDHRAGSYESRGTDRGFRVLPPTPLSSYQDPNYAITPFYWVDSSEVEARLVGKWDRRWLIGFKDITSGIAYRTFIAAIIPLSGVGHTMPLILPRTDSLPVIACLLANCNSLITDYVARQKIGNLHMTYGYVKQLPIVPPDAYTGAEVDFIVPRVLELTYTAHDLAPFALDLGYSGEPFQWDPDRRALLRAELDAYYARLYGLTRDELRYILDPADVNGEDYPSQTFRVLKNDEVRQFGEYRTRRLVLEAWDRLGA